MGHAVKRSSGHLAIGAPTEPGGTRAGPDGMRGERDDGTRAGPDGSPKEPEGIPAAPRGLPADPGGSPVEPVGPQAAARGGPTESEGASARILPAFAVALARELSRRADEEQHLMRQARLNPTPQVRLGLAECRRTNADALATIVRRHGWPAADLVGAPASTAALMILLHAPDLDFQLRCRELIAQATADGRCPGPHHAYIADHCAVALGQPQFYGTRVNPATFRPYPTRRPDTLDERRRDVGLAPLDEQMRALRRGA